MDAAATRQGSSPPRVLLVEDDAAIRHFVEMALEDMPLTLVPCPTLARARAELAAAPAALVLLDMMLPDGSGLQLLEQERRRPGTQAGTHWVLFSASVSPVLHHELAELGIQQVLAKPVTLRALLACVQAALLAHAGSPEAARPTDADPGVATPGADAARTAADGSAQACAEAIQRYFESDAALFALMRERSLQQFVRDLQDGDAALARGDGPALRRVSHSLKTVLRMLGHPNTADIAQSLEAAAERGERLLWPSLWQALRGRLQRLTETQAGSMP